MGGNQDIAIIGGGPAGLMAAEILARAGKKVALYDRKPSVGRKFLMAGRGGLNLTHSEDLERFITRYGDAADYLRPMIEAFSPKDLIAWCEELGEKTFVGSSGRVFPESFKASPLLRAWIERLENLGVTFHRQMDWTGWNADGALIFKDKAGKETIRAFDATLLALGGASWPGLGSDGSWAALLAGKGVTISPLRPANCGFVCAWSEIFRDKFSGTPLKTLRLTCGDKISQGDVMISRNGIEGGAVYALSSFIRDVIDEKGSAELEIDLRPSMDLQTLSVKLSAPRKGRSFSNHLQKTVSLPPLAISLLREADEHAAQRAPEELAHLIKSLKLRLTAPFPIDRAISSAGGISLSELDDNAMIAKIPGVFAAGEMLDWEAPTGGYLLQASYATGVHAAGGILRYLQS